MATEKPSIYANSELNNCIIEFIKSGKKAKAIEYAQTKEGWEYLEAYTYVDRMIKERKIRQGTSNTFNDWVKPIIGGMIVLCISIMISDGCHKQAKPEPPSELQTLHFKALDYIRASMKDPDSFKLIKWSDQVYKYDDGRKMVWIEFSGKNRLGTMDKAARTFIFDSQDSIIEITTPAANY